MAIFNRTVKRFTALALISALIAGFAPFSASALPTDGNSLINVTSATSSFNPSAGQSATINYSVLGPNPATLTTARIYRASPTTGTNVCNPFSSQLVGTIDGPATKAVGSHSAVWTGLSAIGTPLPVGLYCYRLSWGNPPFGANSLIEGLISISSLPTPQTPGTPGTPSPTPGTPVPPGGTFNPIGSISASVSPSQINPSDPARNTAFISYTALTNLPAGYSVRIVDGSNVLIKNLINVNQFVPAGTNAVIAWNATRNDGSTVGTGNYFFVFNVSGVDVLSGLIRVETTVPTPPLPPVSDITHSINRSFIDPSAVPTQVATINFSVNRRLANGLSVMVRDSGGRTIRPLFVTLNPVEIGNHFVVWDGRLAGGQTVPADIYRYVFVSGVGAGSELASGSIEVRYASLVSPFVVSHSATPPSFSPLNGESTTISFTLGRNVSNFSLAILPQGGATRTLLRSEITKSAGSYSVVWAGNLNGVLASPGVYTYLFEANGETPVTGTVTVSSLPANAPVITDLGPTPSSFDPNSQSTTFRFNLNQDARADLTIFSSGIAVRRLLASGTLNNAFAFNINSVSWDGRNDFGQILPAGTYTYVIEARNANGTAVSRTGTVTISTTPQTGLILSNVFADPNPFNPDIQNTQLRFSLNQSANVNLTITRQSNGALIRTISSQFFNSGQNSIVWNGSDQNGFLVPSDTYNVRVNAAATSTGTTHFVDISVTASRAVAQTLQITDNGPTPNPFNVQTSARTQINFSLNLQPTSVSVRVHRASTNALIRELQVFNMGGLVYRAEWDGKDSSNNFVSADTYLYRIEAIAQGQSAQRTGTISLINSGVTPPQITGNCAGFTDVLANSPLCPAIEFARSRGIFVGYPDGTLAPDRVIQRAELLAVIQNAFDYPLDPYNAAVDGNLGFFDLTNLTNQWFMPYIKTFSRLRIMVGYPDGRMRPERTMSTAELYVVFLKAAKQAPTNIANFELFNMVRQAPFVDTPVNRDTIWYLKYAEFARLNQLVQGNFFNPALGITRGQVIKLIFDTHQKGLINYGPAITPLPFTPLFSGTSGRAGY